jgi:hypothetical protein
MLGKMILSMDKLGTQYKIRYHGETRFKTLLGAFLTVLSLMIFLAFFFLTGFDFYMRVNPFLSMSKTLTSQYFNYTLKKENFLFAFRIESNGKILERSDLFYIEPHYIVFNQTEEGMKKIVDEIIPYHKCKFEDANYNQVYNSSVMSQFLCLNQPSENEGYVGGGLYDALYIKYFKIKFSHCSAGANYNIENNITCNKNLTEFKNLFSRTSLYVKYIIQSFYVDSSDYNDPFKLSFDSMYQTMELNTQKKRYFYFKNGILNDDKGWILEDKNYKELIGLDRQRLDFRDGNSDYNKNTFYEINLYFDRIVENYMRKYQKIQNVPAGVGGLIKIITFVFGNLVFYYNEHYQYLDFINNELLKNNNNNNDNIYKGKFENSINKLNNNKNNFNINYTNNLNNFNPNISDPYKDLSSNILQQNQNLNHLVSSHGNYEQNHTVLYNPKSINPEPKFSKMRSVSVFKKISDEKILSVNSGIKKFDIDINNKENVNFKDNELNYYKPINNVSISFTGYFSYFIFGKLKKRKNEHYYNFIKFRDITDKYLDLGKFLQFFSRYEPLLDQLAVSADPNLNNNNNNNNMILNN